MLDKLIPCFAGKAFHVFFIPTHIFLGEKIHKKGDIFFPFPKGRHPDSYNIKPVVKVFAKTSFFYLLFKVLVRCNNNPYVNFYRVETAKTFHLFFLDDPQQLRLE